MYAQFVVLSVCAGLGLAQVYQNGNCSSININAMNNFQPSQYTGIWYEISRVANTFEMGDCNKANYTFVNQTAIKVDNTEVVKGELKSKEGVAVANATDGAGKFNVIFEMTDKKPSSPPTTSPYWVLTTDYSNYALVYSCSEVNDTSRAITLWKLSRKPTLGSFETQVNSFIAAIPELSSTPFRLTNHSATSCKLTNAAATLDSKTVLISTVFLVIIKTFLTKF